MRKRLSICILLVIILALLSPAAVVAQSKKRTTATPRKAPAAKGNPPAANAPAYDTKPFDSSTNKLPLRYRGHSFRRIYETVVLVPPKGEFETTAEYQQRSHRTVDGVYAFVLDDWAVKIAYNADAEVMEVRAEANDFRPGGRERETGYRVEMKKVSEREYPASNAFGASVVVTETNWDVSGIIPKPGPLSGGVILQITRPRAEAQRVKPDLRVLAVVRIADEQESPITTGGEANGFWSGKATIDDPTEISERQFLLRVELVDLWVFNRSTGEVLAKHSDRPDHNKMQVSVSESMDLDGHAEVSLSGNKALTLKRGFSNLGGGCHIVVGGYYKVTGMKDGVWVAGMSMVDLRGRKRVVVTSYNGAVAFDRASPSEFGDGSDSAWPDAREAALAMWNAAPGGFVEIKGDERRGFATKAPLAGFRELWEWGVGNCGFPSLSNE